ncbi:odorant receptor Or1-like [Leguminivora glycinivorella]|uniref:odorant receptor Or1-like n=1 Tax=Leguminivora glycinivorella TaxID=1035111 RepID=UPI00200E7F81|nr:odorant receptor Or1-like [Leguminivora glycinivorella]
MITQYTFVFFEFIYIALAMGDLDAVTEASFLLFTQASVCYKVTRFLTDKNSLISLLGMMEQELFQAQNERQVRCLIKQSTLIKRLCLFFLVNALNTTTLWGLMPIVDSTGGERIFPFLIWMPVSPKHSPQYELGYFYQMVAIYISAFLFSSIDSVALSMIMFGCAQLEIIMDKVEQIKRVPMSGKLKPQDREELLQENQELFVECLKHHQAVIRFIELVEDTYHSNIFFQLSGSVAIICIVGLRITATTPGSVEFISMLNYMVAMLSQVFLYCWCGNELTTRSEILRDVMYLCPWNEQTNGFRKLLWIAMERMKRPIVFRAGHYIALSRPTFVSILRSSYSYFAVLNQTQGQEKLFSIMVKSEINIGDLYLSRAKFIMSLLGVWMPPPNESILRKCYKFFMLFLQYIFLIFQVIYMCQVLGDIEEVSQSSFLLFTQACLCFKVTVFHVNIDSFRDLLAQMNTDIFMPQNECHEKILKLQALRIKRLLMWFMVCSQTTCSLFVLRPLFDDANRSFPFKMWMPVSPDHSPQYELGFLFQVLTISMSAFMYFGVDSVCLSMVIFGCAEIDIIKEKIMTVKPIAEQRVNRSITVKSILNEHYRVLIECVAQHVAIIKFVKQVEVTYHSYLLFQLSGGVGLICMSALRILVVDWKSVQFLSVVMYLMAMISQLFVCCWSGHELTATSSELHTVMYECCWYEQDMRFKRVLLFMMLRLGRPLEFRAGRYVTLSRQTFVAILRMSYSYFAVLKQTTTRNEAVEFEN